MTGALLARRNRHGVLSRWPNNDLNGLNCWLVHDPQGPQALKVVCLDPIPNKPRWNRQANALVVGFGKLNGAQPRSIGALAVFPADRSFDLRPNFLTVLGDLGDGRSQLSTQGHRCECKQIGFVVSRRRKSAGRVWNASSHEYSPQIFCFAKNLRPYERDRLSTRKHHCAKPKTSNDTASFDRSSYWIYQNSLANLTHGPIRRKVRSCVNNQNKRSLWSRGRTQ